MKTIILSGVELFVLVVGFAYVSVLLWMLDVIMSKANFGELF